MITYHRKKELWQNKNVNDLFFAVLKLKDTKEAKKFFRDLLTVREIQEFSQRWKVARLLHEKVPYTVIEKKTGMSSTTIARIHKWLTKGMGGYQMMIQRIKKKN